MSRLKDPDLFRLVHDFFKVYLPKQRCCSLHTIKNYRTSLELLLDFIKRENDISLSYVTFEMLNAATITAFLDALETERGCSITTRNQRLKCIWAFFNYIAAVEPETVIYQMEAKRVVTKKAPESNTVEYMSELAVKTMLEIPDTSTKNGLRDMCYMVLTYDTAARVQEMLDLRICDIHVGATPTAVLHGKGLKTRTVPLMDKTIEHLKSYLEIFHSDENTYSKQPLFYVKRDGEKKMMSDDNIRKFMKKYSNMAHKICSEVPEQVYPHLWRHSRAMHLYQHGMDLTLVSQWLGHANLETTLIYAHADTEQKRKAIQKAMATQVPFMEEGASRFTIDNDDVIKQLYGLK